VVGGDVGVIGDMGIVGGDVDVVGGTGVVGDVGTEGEGVVQPIANKVTTSINTREVTIKKFFIFLSSYTTFMGCGTMAPNK